MAKRARERGFGRSAGLGGKLGVMFRAKVKASGQVHALRLGLRSAQCFG